MSIGNNTPILLIIFNRPEATQIVFNALCKIKPLKLYISADAPRTGNEPDQINCRRSREIVTKIDWECETYFRFLDHNLGCGKAVSSAISWAFEKEEKLIIIEDDCIPTFAFIDFCNYCLDKYCNDEIVMQIAGNNYTENHNFSNQDYFFSKYGHIWGWATWKRAWRHFDYEMRDWPRYRDLQKLSSTLKSQKTIAFFRNVFDIYYSDPNKPWAIRWLFAKFKSQGLTIVPCKNLVRNIGSIGTHSNKEYFYRVTENYKFENEPLEIICNERYDDYHFKHHINAHTNIFLEIYIKLKKNSAIRKIKKD